MSLILEALRKSEAERRIGHAPGLLTPMPSYRRSRHRALHWLLGGALVAALAGGAWWLGRQGATVPPPAAMEATAPPPAIEAPAPPAPVDATPPVDAAPRQAVDPAPPAVAAPAAAEQTAPPAPPPAFSAPVEPAAPTPAPEAAAAPQVPVQDMPRLDQLGAIERSRLPALKLSMHVYADAPERRFVMLDGQRHTEGQTIAPGLVVREIRRDGVVLEHEGSTFLLQSR